LCRVVQLAVRAPALRGGLAQPRHRHRKLGLGLLLLRSPGAAHRGPASRSGGAHPDEVSQMQTRRLGSQGLEVSAIGLGCMGMSWAYGTADEQESLRVLDHALRIGVNFL